MDSREAQYRNPAGGGNAGKNRGGGYKAGFSTVGDEAGKCLRVDLRIAYAIAIGSRAIVLLQLPCFAPWSGRHVWTEAAGSQAFDRDSQSLIVEQLVFPRCSAGATIPFHQCFA